MNLRLRSDIFEIFSNETNFKTEIQTRLRFYEPLVQSHPKSRYLQA